MPAVCPDGEGGAYVAWEEDDGSSEFVRLVRYTAIGGLVQNWSTLAGDEKPELVGAMYCVPATGVVTFTGDGGYLATINNGDAKLRCFNTAGLTGQIAQYSGRDVSSIKIATDYYKGSFAVFASANELIPMHSNYLYTTQSKDEASNGRISAVDLDGFDITTDVINLHRFTNHHYNYDCIICASKAGGAGGNQITCWRFVEQTSAGDFDREGEITLITDAHSSHPAIAADSIPNILPELASLGGALVSWDEYDQNQQLHKVLSNRIRWWYDDVNDTYQSGVLYVDGNGDQLHALVADSCQEQTWPDIAKINTVISYPTSNGDPVPLRYGVTTWTDDRIISCATVTSILAQVLDYTDWTTDPAWAVRLGDVGAVVSPYVGSFEQSGGYVETNLLNSFSLVWKDTRTDSANIMSTTMAFDQTTAVESWLKRSSKPAIARTVVSQNIPNPLRAAAGTLIPIALAESAPVVLRVFDALGRLFLERDCGILAAGAHELPLSGGDVGTLRPGVYFYAVSTGMHTSVRSMVVLH
jgi:hypothetical protein